MRHLFLLASTTIVSAFALSACSPAGDDAGEPGLGSSADALSSSDRESVQNLLPDALVRTPFGVVPRRCVTFGRSGDQLDSERGVVTHADGSGEPLAQCDVAAIPLGDARSASNPEAETPPVDSGWIEDAERNSATPVQGLSAHWTVPGYPTDASDQLLYMFPALEPANGAEIVQPVLQYGSNGGWGGLYYTMASWYGGAGGKYYASTPVRVYPGDEMYGSMWGIGCNHSTGHCSSWDVNTRDLTRGTSTVFSHVTGPAGYAYSWLFAGVLEAYNVNHCSEYPPPGEPGHGAFDEFYDVVVHKIDGSNQPIGYWNHSIHRTTCGESISSGTNYAFLHY